MSALISESYLVGPNGLYWYKPWENKIALRHQVLTGYMPLVAIVLMSVDIRTKIKVYGFISSWIFRVTRNKSAAHLQLNNTLEVY